MNHLWLRIRQKINVLLKLIKHQQPDIDKRLFICQRSIWVKVWIAYKEREKVGIKNAKNLKAFINYSQIMGNVYKNLQHYNPTKKSKILIVFDNIIANIETNEKLSPIAIELFLKGRKLNISLVFILQSYFENYKIKDSATYIWFFWYLACIFRRSNCAICFQLRSWLKGRLLGRMT